ncbi:methyl-accepting chemotaxis protein (MCP) signaling protein [Paenibacillus taihuensis]|uniref:Methyl-accepting chemotaxis protein (MCP) signaling protein n=1 Tax=Paenibacillus taihuensis TaxID=1156355 RepID=A0A3D9S111_9BACL|nr:methyl-accepting chemotaxis protein [Paenibacillus taihuensis]REE86133.1 methyl-accepting chemotaxis protein (MCP) signaling protein [Paenibacillus taihuensis]
MHPILEQYISLSKGIQALYPDDAHIAIFDTEKLIHSLPGTTVNLGLQLGTPISAFKGLVPEKVMNTMTRQTEDLPSGKLPVPVKSVGIPIFDENDEMIGIVAIISSAVQMYSLRDASKKLIDLLSGMSETTNQISLGSSDITEQLQEVSGSTQAIKNDIQQIQETLLFVEEVASQSNLLGLNAAIEAARAGEHGRGFNIVATEIRKMADKSKEAAQTSKEQLELILKAYQGVNDAVQQIAAITQEHSAGLEELNSTFSHIESIASTLK